MTENLLQHTADTHRMAYIGKKPGGQERDSDAWFTPPEYLATVRKTLGHITLDPFSSMDANQQVKALYYFDIQNSAFENSWRIKPKTTVFMNPPYSAKLITPACMKFVEEWKKGSFQEAIVLVNNATDTKWFNLLLAQASAVCFTNHRISFWNVDGKRMSGNTRGQAFLYFGTRSQNFSQYFTQYGFILEVKK